MIAYTRKYVNYRQLKAFLLLDLIEPSSIPTLNSTLLDIKIYISRIKLLYGTITCRAFKKNYFFVMRKRKTKKIIFKNSKKGAKVRNCVFRTMCKLRTTKKIQCLVK